MCDKVEWVDKEWPLPLKNALVKLWSMYDAERDERMNGNVNYATVNYKLVQKTRELEKKNLELHKQLGDTLEYVAEATTHELEYAKRQQAELQVACLKEATIQNPKISSIIESPYVLGSCRIAPER